MIEKICARLEEEKEAYSDTTYYVYGVEAAIKIVQEVAKEYEGRVIELPCKMGDTVFLLMNGNTRIVECTVLWIEWHRNGTVVFSLDGGTGDVVMAHLGKKWFLTRSEAEEALAKMGGKE